MLAFNKIFNQLRRIIAIAFLAGLVFLIPILCEAAYNALSMECWGYTNKAHLRGLILCIFILNRYN
jgi:hypothetical protein